MPSFSRSMELWQVIMTVGPLAAGTLGAGAIARYPRRFSWIFGAYAVVAALIAVAPFALAGAGEVPAATLRPILVEAKMAIAFGAILILGAAGLWGRRTRPPAL